MLARVWRRQSEFTSPSPTTKPLVSGGFVALATGVLYRISTLARSSSL